MSYLNLSIFVLSLTSCLCFAIECPFKAFRKAANVDLVEAVTTQDETQIKALLASGVETNLPNFKGETPLIEAIYCRTDPIVKMLLDAGANPNLPNNKHTPLTAAIDLKRAEVVEILLKAGANPNLEDPHGYAPLTYAMGFGFSKIEKILIEYGAKRDRVDIEKVSQ